MSRVAETVEYWMTMNQGKQGKTWNLVVKFLKNCKYTFLYFFNNTLFVIFTDLR